MKSCGVSVDEFLDYHVKQMELHRVLLTIDQQTVGKYVEIEGERLPVPLHPERGVFVICDIR